ncbi:uncharacterized protein LOC108344990 isoform X2 [Vigna angularis]|uniref:uncharacterized protein LOC108344990 isoform X2 n=1 Tax=Phaseolus angularis TaxID=3914 RepID=UPI00080A588F|nr:uncharacterized protein LOC108344990 isoform X2 [Vigna angularis]
MTKVSALLSVIPTKVDFMSTYAMHLREIIKERIDHPLYPDTPLQGFQGVPSLFSDLSSLYNHPGKVSSLTLQVNEMKTIMTLLLQNYQGI